MTVPAHEADQARQPVRDAAVLVGGFVALLWVLELVDLLLGNPLDQHGVRPRSDEGLVGILLAPLLHGGFGHLASNTVPLLVLGFLVALSSIGRALAAVGVIWLVSGLGTWLVAPAGTVHIGASGLVFGLVTYLVARGLFTRSLGQIALGVLVLVVYGGVLWGVLPGQPGISWQGHLFGALGGVAAAALLAPRRQDVRRRPALAGG